MTDSVHPSLDDWRDVYRASVKARGPVGTHPSEDDWERLATDRLPADARVAIGDHVVTCEACLATFRAVIHVRGGAVAVDPVGAVAGEASDERALPPTTRTWPLSARWALAASLVAALGLGMWAAAMQRRPAAVVSQAVPPASQTPPALPPASPDLVAADVPRLERELADARARIASLESAAAAVPVRTPPALAVPELDVALVDLEPVDALRSGASRPTPVTVPRDSSRVALVLAVPGAVAGTTRRVEIRDGSGRTLWQGAGARVTAERTMVLVVPRALLPAGRVVVQVREPRGSERDAIRFEAQLDYR